MNLVTAFSLQDSWRHPLSDGGERTVPLLLLLAGEIQRQSGFLFVYLSAGE
jgi:hypothetical protein